MNSRAKAFLLLAMQVVAHGGLGVFVWRHLGWANLALVLGCYGLMMGCGITVTLHRYLSHRSFEFRHPALKLFFLACATWALVGPPLGWAMVHRDHHRFPDTERDPHSPHVLGFAQVQWLPMFARVARPQIKDLLADPLVMFLSRHYFALHAALFVLLALAGERWLVCLYLAPAALAWNMGSFVNTLNHMIGYRNFDTADRSTNHAVLGYLTFGEGWHNNHHHQPASPVFGDVRPWEFDGGKWLIRLAGRGA